MEDARKMGKSELFSHFAERFDIKRTQSREFFDELAALAEKELKRTGEFVIPGMVKLVLKKTNARTGRNPATGQPIPIAAKTVVKARIVKQLDSVPAEMTASMCHDLLAGKPIEVDGLSGAVARLAKENGLAAPTHAFIAAALAPFRDGKPQG